LLNSFEIAAVHRLGGAGIVITVGIVVRNIAIKKSVRKNLVDILVLPVLLRLY
jgi:hypothetical protein